MGTAANAKEYIRIAESEGLENVRVEGGSPHGRLIGQIDGHTIVLVVSLTKGAFHFPRRKLAFQCNVRRAVRSLRSGERNPVVKVLKE